MSRLWFRLVLMLIVACAVTGCGGKRTVYPARGKVLDAQGKPLAHARLAFFRADNLQDNDVRPVGTSDEQGNFSLSTYAENDGAPAGDYVVTIAVFSPTFTTKRGGRNKGAPDQLRGKYSNPEQSPIKAKIDKGENNVEIKLPPAG